MKPTSCFLCGATAQKIRQTPTLLGVRPLCDRCRAGYRRALVEALNGFHQQQTSKIEQLVPALRVGTQPRRSAA
jgi:hypothetical protein